MGGRVRGSKSGDAGARRGGRPQRHAAVPGAGSGNFADRGKRGKHSASARWRQCAGGGRRHQADRGIGAAVSDPLTAERPRACAGGTGRRRGGIGSGSGCGDRLWPARPRIPRRDRRATAACRNPQHPRRDCPPGRAERHARLVARAVHRRLPGRADPPAVAHGTRSGLARCGRLEHACTAGIHGMGTAVVCDLGAAASCCQRQSAPVRCHAPRLCVRRSDPPDAG